MEPRDWIGKRVRFKNPPQLDMGVVIDAHETGRWKGQPHWQSSVQVPVTVVTTRTDDGHTWKALYADVLEVIEDQDTDGPRDGAAG